jgi:hypothetical protein
MVKTGSVEKSSLFLLLLPRLPVFPVFLVSLWWKLLQTSQSRLLLSRKR